MQINKHENWLLPFFRNEFRFFQMQNGVHIENAIISYREHSDIVSKKNVENRDIIVVDVCQFMSCLTYNFPFRFTYNIHSIQRLQAR